MATKFSQILSRDRANEVRVRKPIFVAPNTPIKKVLDIFKKTGRGSVIIESKGSLKGIFTERDVMTRVLGPQFSTSKSIDQVMTKDPVVLEHDAPVSEVIRLMSVGKVRHLPLVRKKKVVGIITVRDILDYFSEHFPYEVYNLPPDLNQISAEPEGA